jgi:hypothetical protein
LRAPESPCPRCESPQKFVPRSRPLPDDEARIHVYIKCNLCNWEKILRISTKEIERLRQVKSKLEYAATKQTRRQGQPNASTLTRINVVRSRLDARIAELGQPC